MDTHAPTLAGRLLVLSHVLLASLVVGQLKKQSVSLFVCSDVHGDMSAIVLSLRWPATSLNQALEMPVHTPPPKSKYRSPEQQAASERAQHRWGQVKMLHVEFYRARRYGGLPHCLRLDTDMVLCYMSYASMPLCDARRR